MKKYENKDVIINDINIVINSDLSTNAKTELLHSLAWAYTENDGKIKGCEYWSVEAIKKYEKIIQNEKIRDKNKEFSKILRHEHVVPRNIFVNSVINKKCEITKEDLEGRLVGCVVTKEETDFLDKMYKTKHPDGADFFNIKNVWGRYEGIIEYTKVSWESGKRPKKMITK